LEFPFVLATQGIHCPAESRMIVSWAAIFSPLMPGGCIKSSQCQWWSRLFSIGQLVWEEDGSLSKTTKLLLLDSLLQEINQISQDGWRRLGSLWMYLQSWNGDAATFVFAQKFTEHLHGQRVFHRWLAWSKHNRWKRGPKRRFHDDGDGLDGDGHDDVLHAAQQLERGTTGQASRSSRWRQPRPKRSSGRELDNHAPPLDCDMKGED